MRKYLPDGAEILQNFRFKEVQPDFHKFLFLFIEIFLWKLCSKKVTNTTKTL